MSNPVQIPVFTLQLPGFPVEIAERLDALAANQSPKTTRRHLIEWVLAEYAAGRLVPAETVQGKEAA